MARLLTASTLQALERQHPTELAEAREVASVLWRHRHEFRYMLTYDDLVFEAITEVCLVIKTQSALPHAERVKAAAARLRKQLRRSRSRDGRMERPTVGADGADTLRDLVFRDLLRQLQAHMPDDYPLLTQLLDPDHNCMDIAKRRCGPHADAKMIQLEHGRLRKLKIKLRREAHEFLVAIGAGEL